MFVSVRARTKNTIIVTLHGAWREDLNKICQTQRSRVQTMSTRQLPCKVCQGPSTGVHYGVLSCDACKGFFGRQLKSKGRHVVCPYNKNCGIKRSKKHVCAPCRYRKCLDVGMSVRAIKAGRYSLQWRHSLETELEQFKNSVEEHHQPDDCDDHKIETKNNVCLEARLHNPLGPNGESAQEIIDIIVEAYDHLPSNLRISQEYLDKKAEEYLEKYKLKEMVFGKMASVSTLQFTEIYRQV
ncbi:hypothetical protein RRG08_006291 [Elysia crispata]|uniref:Nuclear receptor domain-containing protein n=1 Tax=Elysia crispata TaxID=231223 RepID=A0AAE0YPS8_9GAST|nr:hypothetical protein RRG08_006291 [Elysia crispata]